jgi:glycosyltransferase involved in cell wall biosynthesis
MTIQPNLSIILPVHNEAKALETVVSQWDTALRSVPGVSHVFIICEDGSTDGTKELIVELEDQYPVINNSVAWRRSYGQAIRDGIALSRTDYVLCIDGDGQIGPDQIATAWARRSEGRLLIGWRYPRFDPRTRLIYSKLFKLYHRVLFPSHLHDPSCPFVFGRLTLLQKVMPLLIHIREGFWWGFTGACWRLKIPMEEIQVHHRERTAGDTRIYKFWKMPGIIFRNVIGLLKLRFGYVLTRER